MSPEQDPPAEAVADPDKPCDHPEFTALVTVNRVMVDDTTTNTTRPAGYSAAIHVTCHTCGEPFQWIGTPGGLNPHQPTTSPDMLELRAPCRPASETADLGLWLPGHVQQ